MAQADVSLSRNSSPAVGENGLATQAPVPEVSTKQSGVDCSQPDGRDKDLHKSKTRDSLPPVTSSQSRQEPSSYLDSLLPPLPTIAPRAAHGISESQAQPDGLLSVPVTYPLWPGRLQSRYRPDDRGQWSPPAEYHQQGDNERSSAAGRTVGELPATCTGLHMNCLCPLRSCTRISAMMRAIRIREPVTSTQGSLSGLRTSTPWPVTR